uniref:Uncharacterized protein n=1 Tax=Physcomitrium patens TaxID=3218 RepID=A0A7I3YWA7_PHYPA
MARFGAPTKVLKNQRRNFLDMFEALYTKALIGHHTISRNYTKADDLVEWIIQIIKHSLQNYELLHSNHCNWNLMFL